DAFRPVMSGEPGLVPPLAGQAASEQGSYSLVPAGTPDSHPDPPQSVRAIAMSGDGSEGWALGPGATNPSEPTLYHFNGVRWTRCDPHASPGDPACAGLAGLTEAAGAPVKIITVARVPLENGSDDSKADDFEVVALGVSAGTFGSAQSVLRYRNG